MKKALLLLIFIFPLSLQLSCVSTKANPKVAIEERFDFNQWPQFSPSIQSAMQHWERGELNEALSSIEADSSAMANLWRGELYYEKANFPEAIRYFTQYLQESQDDSYHAWALLRMINMVLLSVYELDYYSLSKIPIHQLDPKIHGLYAAVLNAAANVSRQTSKEAIVLLDSVITMNEWRMIGPFSVKFSPDLGDPLSPEADSILKEKYTYDGIEIAEQLSTGSLITYRPYPQMGIMYAETTLELEEDLDFVATLISDYYFFLWIDGQLVLKKDFNTVETNSYKSREIKLSKGKHRFRVKFAAHDKRTNPFYLSLSPINKTLDSFYYRIDALDRSEINSQIQIGEKLNILDDFPKSPKALAEHPFFAWLYSLYTINTQGAYSAGLAIKASLELNPNHVPLNQMLIERYGSDNHILDTLRNDYAMSAATHAISLSPQLAQTMLMLVDLQLLSSPQLAAESLNEFIDVLPPNADTHLRRYKVAKALNLTNEAQIALEAAYHSQPSCRTTNLWIQEQFLLQKKIVPMDELDERMLACPDVIKFYRDNFEDTNKDKQAMELEYANLSNRFKEMKYYPSYISTFYKIGEHTLGTELLKNYEDPRSVKAAPDYELLNILNYLYLDNPEIFASTLDSFIEANPSNMSLRNIQAFVSNNAVLADLRKDGLQIIKDHLAEKKNYSYSAYYILDYAAFHYFPDGSAISITHQISRIMNKEGKNLLGEVYLPENAIITKLRTIKHDTLDIVTPENISHKTSITMPKLDDGDFIEVEYYIAEAPVSEFDNSYYVPTWFFKVIDAPLLHSEFIIEYPLSAKPEVEIHNANPLIECQKISEYERCKYRLDMQLPPLREPFSPNSYNFLPMVQIAHKSSIERILSSLNSKIELSTLPSPYLQDAVEEIVMHLPEESRNDKLSIAKAIYKTVQDKVAEKDNYFAGFASQTWNAKTGSRIGLLKALLNIAEIENEAVLILTPDAPNKIASLIPFQLFIPYLRVKIDNNYHYLDPSENFIPFGFLSEDLHNQVLFPIRANNIKQEISPSYDQSKYLSTTNLKLIIDQMGDLFTIGHEVLLGSRAVQLRNVFHELKNDEKRLWRILENSISNSYGLAKLSRLDTQNLQETDLPFVLDYDFSAPNYATINDAGLTVLPSSLAFNFLSKIAPQAERENPFILNESYSQKRNLTFTVPENYHFAGPDQDVKLDSPFGSFQRKLIKTKNSLTIHELTLINPQKIEAQDYGKFRQFLKQIDDAQALPIIAEINP